MSDLTQVQPQDQSAEPLSQPGSLLAPVRPDERINSVDVLRGFSLLGILLMNIVAFGLPFAAYTVPSAYGGADGANLAFWLTNQVLFEGKMRAIFSMLFGASAVILVTRAEKRGAGIEAADVYYRRTLWLIAFGVIHGYFIWSGDILFHYGVVGLALFPFRNMKGRSLVILGGTILAVHSLQGIGGMFHFRDLRQKVAGIEAAEKAGKPLTEEQNGQKEEFDKMRKMFKPDAKEIEKEINTVRGGYGANLGHRAGITSSMQSDLFYRFLIWDVAGMLFLGMGLFKLGVFDASRSNRFYITMAAAGYAIGVPLNYIMGRLWIGTNFDWVSMFGFIMAPSDLGRFSVAAGHVAVVMLLCKAGASWITKPLANVGRMALSNYLLTSILCTLFFNGYGLGFFAKLQRIELLYVVFAMWTINLALSAVWLRYFRFGPAEWLWRSLTYRRKQPMRIADPPAPVEHVMPATA